MNMFYSVFEQFELTIVRPFGFYIGSFFIDLTVTNFTVYLAFAVFVVILFIKLALHNAQLVTANNYQAFVEMIYEFLLVLAKQQAGFKGVRYFSLIFTLFMFILALNLIGLFPYSFTVTGHFVVTFSLSLSLFIALILVGFREQGMAFLNMFLPSNVPNWLFPLLVVIEILSYLIRPLSLAIRLFANMLAGHILLHIFASATILLFNVAVILGFLPWMLLLAFVVLEVGIAFLQTYVFIILFCIYLHDSLYSHH